MIEEEILVTVKTYPTLSKRYIETVCTAGINQQGEWRRLYPIRYRYLAGEQQFRLFDVIRVKLEPVSQDGRVESRRPRVDTLTCVRNIRGWRERHEWVGPTVVSSLADLQSDGRTIGPVRVQEVQEWRAVPTSAEWTPKQQEQLKQQVLWEKQGPQPLEKVPFEFRVKWIDGGGVSHDSMFISWVVCQTWRSFRRCYSDPLATMRSHWMGKVFAQHQGLCFFMGNAAQHRDHFMICGTYNPPKEVESSARLWSCSA